MFRDYKHPNLSIYLFSISENQLIFNENENKTRIFSEWFERDGRPKSMKDLINEITIDVGTFSIKILKEHLNLREEYSFVNTGLDKLLPAVRAG